jgi:aminoglycoside phosphotransferase family enzyme/predicted kinase
MEQYVELRETHSAVVILLGDRAYKVKKPVDLTFLDFSTLTARRRATMREQELNRRMSPDVYLDVDTLTASDGQPQEYVLVMRRMPAADRLSTLVGRDLPVRGHLRALARLVAEFHAGCERSAEISVEGRGPALTRRWMANLEETEQYRGGTLDGAEHAELSSLVSDYLAGRAALLDDRADAGCVVDGHGDLTCEDVFCLPDGPRVLDCLEFDDRLRYVDVIDDVCFLAMDLESLGRADLAERFLDWYEEFSGAPSVVSLRHHYVAYRAFVRAKVACIRAGQGDASAAANAAAHMALALKHARAGQVRLVVVAGPPGSGKTTLAGGLADHLGAVLLSSDRVRPEVPGSTEGSKYTAAGKAAVYGELLRRADVALVHGETVVLDATWTDPASRAAVAALAARTASRLDILECHLDTDVAARRAEQRLRAGTDLSEAGAVVARSLGSGWTSWPDAGPVDTSGTATHSLETALARLSHA